MDYKPIEPAYETLLVAFNDLSARVAALQQTIFAKLDMNTQQLKEFEQLQESILEQILSEWADHSPGPVAALKAVRRRLEGNSGEKT